MAELTLREVRDQMAEKLEFDIPAQPYFLAKYIETIDEVLAKIEGDIPT